MKQNSRPSSKNKPSSGKKPDSGKTKKKKKEVEPYQPKYPPLNFEELLKVPTIELTFRQISVKSDPWTEVVPITHSLNKICEIINERHGKACKNIKLFMDINGNR